MNGLSCDEESMTICSAVLIQYQRVTDRRTDGPTDVQPISITCFSIADARKNRTLNSSFCHFYINQQNFVKFASTTIVHTNIVNNNEKVCSKILIHSRETALFLRLRFIITAPRVYIAPIISVCPTIPQTTTKYLRQFYQFLKRETQTICLQQLDFKTSKLRITMGIMTLNANGTFIFYIATFMIKYSEYFKGCNSLKLNKNKEIKEPLKKITLEVILKCANKSWNTCMGLINLKLTRRCSITQRSAVTPDITVDLSRESTHPHTTLANDHDIGKTTIITAKQLSHRQIYVERLRRSDRCCTCRQSAPNSHIIFVDVIYMWNTERTVYWYWKFKVMFVGLLGLANFHSLMIYS